MAVAKSKAKELGIARVRKKKQITLPDAVMEVLQLREGQELRFVVKGGRVYLEPVVTVRVPPDEAYAFTPEWQTMIRRSLEDIRVGRAFTVRAEEIPTLIERLKKEGKL